jgi:hypothetical protein
MLALSDAHRDARLQATATRINAGSLALFGTIRPFMFGADPGAPPLVTIPLSDPCGIIASGVLTLTPSGEIQVTTTGTPIWGRFYDAQGAPDMDADVGVEIIIPAPTIYAGGFTRLVSAAFV